MNETEEGREQTRKWIKEIYEWGELHDHRRPLHLKKKKNKLVLPIVTERERQRRRE